MRNMRNYRETMTNCRSFILNHPLVENGYENFDCSNCSGFELTLKNGHSVKIRIDKSIDYVIFETYPGILVRGPYLPMVAEYCQQATRFPAITFLTADVDQGSIYLHSEQSFRDEPVSEAHFGRMLTDAVNDLAPHIPVLQSLAYGRLPDLKQLCRLEESPLRQNDCVHTPEEQELLDRTMESIQEYLQDSGHNVVGRNIDPNSDLAFFSETMTRDSRYRTFYYIRNGYLIQAVRMDIRIEPGCRTQAAQFANKSSDEKKVGFLTVLTPDGYAYVVMSQYLLDGKNPITPENLDHMENIAISFLHFSEKSLRGIAQGLQIPDEAEPKSERPAPRRDRPSPPVDRSALDGLFGQLLGGMKGMDDDSDDGVEEDEEEDSADFDPDTLDALSGLDLD